MFTHRLLFFHVWNWYTWIWCEIQFWCIFVLLVRLDCKTLKSESVMYFCCCNFMVAGRWIFIYKTMNVITIKLTEIVCNSFSRSYLIGAHLFFFWVSYCRILTKIVCAAANVAWPQNWSCKGVSNIWLKLKLFV